MANKWKRRAKSAEAQALAAGAARLAADETVAVLVKVIETLRDQPESVIRSITPLILGYTDDRKPDDNKMRLQQMISGMDDQEQRGLWFPDVEFDTTMEAPERWPEPGTISGTPTGPMTQPMTKHRITNGEVQRSDGQAMFRAGTTGPPPVSGQE